MVKKLPAMQETSVQSLGWEDPLEKGKTAHSSILAWRIPRTFESMGCKELDTTEQLSLSLPKDLNRHFSQEDTQISKNTQNIINIISNHGNKMKL